MAGVKPQHHITPSCSLLSLFQHYLKLPYAKSKPLHFLLVVFHLANRHDPMILRSTHKVKHIYMDVDDLSAPKPHSLIKTDNKDSVKYFF